MKFTEAKLEKVFTELLQNEGFPHHLGITIKRSPDEVLIEEDLQNFLLNQYKKDGITVNEVKSIILNLKSLPASDLCENNKKCPVFLLINWTNMLYLRYNKQNENSRIHSIRHRQAA